MDLFEFDNSLNLLPYDGIVNYFGSIFSSKETQEYYKALLNEIEWKNDEVIIYGKHIITKRRAAWYGDENYHYSYSNTTKYALSWTKELLTLKVIVENKTGVAFNSCLLNLYHNGSEGMTWHSDDEAILNSEVGIASLSFGETRKFSFKHKGTKEIVSLQLESGSLLIMKGATQQHWLHALPKTVKATEPRINLTFRVVRKSL